MERAAVIRADDCSSPGGKVRLVVNSVLANDGIESAGGGPGGKGDAATVGPGETGDGEWPNWPADRGRCFAVEPVCSVRAGRHRPGRRTVHERDGL